MIVKSEYFSTGHLISTRHTEKWTPEERKRVDAIERRTIYFGFNVMSEGRGRIFVCRCATKEKANSLIEMLNKKEVKSLDEFNLLINSVRDKYGVKE